LLLKKGCSEPAAGLKTLLLAGLLDKFWLLCSSVFSHGRIVASDVVLDISNKTTNNCASHSSKRNSRGPADGW
jgi:hypothetical protein